MCHNVQRVHTWDLLARVKAGQDIALTLIAAAADKDSAEDISAWRKFLTGQYADHSDPLHRLLLQNILACIQGNSSALSGGLLQGAFCDFILRWLHMPQLKGHQQGMALGGTCEIKRKADKHGDCQMLMVDDLEPDLSGLSQVRS